MSKKTAENGINPTHGLKVNITKLKTQFKTDVPYLNDLVFAGVSQFLGVKNGPMEMAGITGLTPGGPHVAMLQFLQDMEILIPEGKEEEKEVAIHS